MFEPNRIFSSHRRRKIGLLQIAQQIKTFKNLKFEFFKVFKNLGFSNDFSHPAQ